MNSRIPTDIDVEARLATVRANLLTAVPKIRTRRFGTAGRVGIALGSATVLVGALTGGAIAVIQATQEQVSYSVRCYSGSSLSADFTTVANPEATNLGTGEISRDRTDPVSTCGDIWRSGLLGQEITPSDPNGGDFPVPELVGCELDNGIGAGFPLEGSMASATTFCEDMGLQAWDN